jgi:hypothetical protein
MSYISTVLVLRFTVLVLHFTVLILHFTVLALHFTVLVLHFTVLVIHFTVLVLNSRCLGRARVSVYVRGLQYDYFVKDTFLRWGVVSNSPNSPSWRITPCRPSATSYSIYSQLPSILEAVSLSTTWGSAMPWWQGPTYLGSGKWNKDGKIKQRGKSGTNLVRDINLISGTVLKVLGQMVTL